MDIPYDHLGGVHSLTGLITESTTYAAEHGNVAFVRPTRLPLYDANIPDNAATVVQVKLETAHQALVDDYASFEAAERGVPRRIRYQYREPLHYLQLGKNIKTYQLMFQLGLSNL